jgi:deoxycytidine triphosphate deaminase
MPVLSDGSIRKLIAAGRVRIDPWDDEMVQPASVDLRLGPSFRVFHNFRVESIDLADPPTNLTEHIEIRPDEPFVIHPGEFVLGRTEEYVELPDDLVARIEGKALAVDTPIPTPRGWRTMGELEIGDEVFGLNGRSVPIVDATETMTDRECREVVFSDGTSIVCDLDHQWPVRTKYDARIGRHHRVLTTREMERRGVREGKDFKFRLPKASSIRYREKALPVDPYVFGIWIGDGTSTCAEVTSADPVILREIELAGYAVSKAAGPYRFRIGGAPRLRDERAGQYTANASLNSTLRAGNVCGERHEVTFTPHERVFGLPRKGERQRFDKRFDFGRSIVDIRPVESVPVRCIEVGHPSGIYLASRSFIPTHNSSLGRLGLIVHATAGFVDPGFKGTLTLEITNLTRVPIKLWAGKPIAQLSFMTLDEAAERPYGHPELGSHYHGQIEATESRYEGGPARR